MRLKDLQQTWERLGREDPLWAVLTRPQYKGGRWDVDEFFATGSAEVTRILGQLGRLRDVEVNDALDFGCGTGRLTQALSATFGDACVVGVDISPSMIEHARRFAEERGWDRCRFAVNERPDLAMFADASFDLVLSELTLLHMEPRYSLSYLCEFLRVLRPDGVAIIQVPEPTRRQLLRDLVPGPVVTLGTRLRAARGARMEMYGLSRHDVVEAVHRAGGHVFGIYDRGRQHREFADLRYFVSPRPADEELLWAPVGASPVS